MVRVGFGVTELVVAYNPQPNKRRGLELGKVTVGVSVKARVMVRVLGLGSGLW